MPPFFLNHPPVNPACPVFKIFVSTPLFYIPLLFKVFQAIPLTLMQITPSCPNLTHQPSLHKHTDSFLDNLQWLSLLREVIKIHSLPFYKGAGSNYKGSFSPLDNNFQVILGEWNIMFCMWCVIMMQITWLFYDILYATFPDFQ